MTNFLPIFPLASVVYPGEPLNLHIFEPRYKQMIIDCTEGKKPFGVPGVVDNKITEFGTSIEIIEITKVHENGNIDVKTIGRKVFRVLEIVKEVPDKLYNGAIVNYPENIEKGNPELMRKVVELTLKLYADLDVKEEFKKPVEELQSYDLGHHSGLSLLQEYELLSLLHEMQRQEYIKQHLLKLLPIVAELNALKKKVKLNGHFKDLYGFNFEA